MRRSEARFSLRTFGLVLLIGLLPWPGLNAAFGGLYRGVMNATIGHVSFGDGGQVEFLPTPESASADLTDVGTWDTVLALSIGGKDAGSWVGSKKGQRPMIAVNPRRRLLLAWVLTTALIFALRFRGRRQLEAWSLATALLFAWAIMSTYLLVLFTFTRLPSTPVHLSPGPKAVLDILYKGVVAPPGNRFLEPLVVVAIVMMLPRYRHAVPFRALPKVTGSDRVDRAASAE